MASKRTKFSHKTKSGHVETRTSESMSYTHAVVVRRGADSHRVASWSQSASAARKRASSIGGYAEEINGGERDGVESVATVNPKTERMNAHRARRAAADEFKPKGGLLNLKTAKVERPVSRKRREEIVEQVANEVQGIANAEGIGQGRGRYSEEQLNEAAKLRGSGMSWAKVAEAVGIKSEGYLAKTMKERDAKIMSEVAQEIGKEAVKRSAASRRAAKPKVDAKLTKEFAKRMGLGG